MKTVALIYLVGLVPAFLGLRYSFIRLTDEEEQSAGDILLTAACSLCSWISVVVSLIMIGVIAISDLERKPLNGR